MTVFQLPGKEWIAMLVREMSRQECEELLARLSFGRLPALATISHTLLRCTLLPITAISMALPPSVKRSHGCA